MTTFIPTDRLVRYCLVSVITVLLGQAVLGVCFGMLEWPARRATVAAAVVTTMPAYYLNRTWVWGKRGRSRLVGELVPFWALALAGLCLSTWMAGLTEARAATATSRLEQTTLVMATVLFAYGLVWLVKFLVLNHLLFVPTRAPSPQSAGGTRGASAVVPGMRRDHPTGQGVL